MDYRIIEEFYDIGRIQRLVVMKQGTSSDAKCVESSAGRFVLRKLRNEQQAVNEERLHHVMSLQNISPALVIARNGLSYVHLNDEIYNLQYYVEETVPYDQATIHFVEFGKMLARFHHAAHKLEIVDQPDRFALPLLWSQVCDEVRGSSSMICSLEGQVQQCIEYAVRKESVIHGDLGVWNMLFTKQKTLLIDFGEVRRGDPHVDVAAALTSMIPATATENECFSILEDVMKGYAQAEGLLTRDRLYEQIHLWMLRGWLAWIRERGVTSPMVQYIEQGMQRVAVFKEILL
ncbi:Ser/Thr protein kinase RdoA (MazF antagonist) [Paenibacillus sp. JGP012]|uniref:phosphotransferase n=1 Tax=Paenibacillus sp. JGP012 TaxID=2735914 RepID=UPI001620F9A9|nr:phosphotransferase [Paenibacillus sp. JGP012]MBB6020986.1 Ser/Thr protein kinase RdoA (MazF antagonist) [Paenibacillus sp. JGP012]